MGPSGFMPHTHKPPCPHPTPSGTLDLHSAEDFQDFRMTQNNLSPAEEALRDAARDPDPEIAESARELAARIRETP